MDERYAEEIIELLHSIDKKLKLILKSKDKEIKNVKKKLNAKKK